MNWDAVGDEGSGTPIAARYPKTTGAGQAEKRTTGAENPTRPAKEAAVSISADMVHHRIGKHVLVLYAVEYPRTPEVDLQYSKIMNQRPVLIMRGVHDQTLNVSPRSSRCAVGLTDMSMLKEAVSTLQVGLACLKHAGLP